MFCEFINCRDQLIRSLLTRINLIPFEKFFDTHLLPYGCDSFDRSTNKDRLLPVAHYLKGTLTAHYANELTSILTWEVLILYYTRILSFLSFPLLLVNLVVFLSLIIFVILTASLSCLERELLLL